MICKHKGIIFKTLGENGVKEYRKYVGGLRKCRKCRWYVGDKSLQRVDKSVVMERSIKNANNKKVR